MDQTGLAGDKFLLSRVYHEMDVMLSETGELDQALITMRQAASLGGEWWPLEIVSEWMRSLGHALPTAWAMDGFNNIIIRGLGLEVVLPEVVVLLGFAALFLAIGGWRFRYE